MKRLFRSTSKGLSLFLAIFLIAPVALGSDYYGIIKEMSGKVFLSVGDRTVEAQAGSKIFDSTEIMTTAGAQVSVMDRFDHVLHLAGSGHIKVNGRQVELVRGYLWMQSMRKRSDEFQIKTANATVRYRQGEGIISFDESSGKTQVLSVRGPFKLSYNMNNNYFETVREGQFSFIKDSYKEGRPRRATEVGYDSYEKVTDLFKGVEPVKKTFSFPKMQGPNGKDPSRETPQKSSRSVASKSSSEQEGEIRYIKTEMSAKEKEELKKYYHKQLADMDQKKNDQSAERSPSSESRPFRPSYEHKSDVMIRVFGRQDSSSKRSPSSNSQSSSASKAEKRKASSASSQGRGPASLQDLNPQVEIKDDAFEKGLSEQVKKQMRHESEVNSLIKELKTYDQDYQSSY